jgi:serine/threonine protein kinase
VKALLTALGCLSSALLYLHVSQNIKHKDIKPENILVDRHGSVLLADFGISKQYQGETVTWGPTAFTEKYAAPEVAAQGSRDLSADIFSLGCVFLEMVTVILSESLKSLHKEVFDRSDCDSCSKQAYCHSLPKVKHWICHLKDISPREESLWEGRSYSSPSESERVNDHEHTSGKHSLQEQHLDMILVMMSESPDKRPSIRGVHQLFKEFAVNCSDCHDSVDRVHLKDRTHNIHQGPHTERDQSSAGHALSPRPTAPLTRIKSPCNGLQRNVPHPYTNGPPAQAKEGGERCRIGSASGTKMITNRQQVSELTYHSAHQPIGQSDIGEIFTPCTVSWAISLLILAAANHQYSQTSLASCSYAANQYDRLSAAKASGNLRPILDEHEEDDDSSEVETYYSDSEISDDEDPVADSTFDDLAAKVKSLVFSLLESNYSAGLFNCYGSGESPAPCREGSTGNGPPSKKRSIGHGKSVPSSQDDDPDDGGDEPEERRGQNIEDKSNVPLQHRKSFACQFYQRDSSKCTNRSCSGPGFSQLHRLK